MRDCGVVIVAAADRGDPTALIQLVRAFIIAAHHSRRRAWVSRETACWQVELSRAFVQTGGMRASPPFTDVLEAFADQAVVEARALDRHESLTSSAWIDARDGLLERLGEIAGPALIEAFSPSRSLPLAARLLDETPLETPRASWRAFVEKVRAQGLEAVLAPWPALMPRLRRVRADWVESIALFLEHLAQDAAELPNGPVRGVTLNLSDPHAGGRAVMKVEFSDGRAMAYKPRGLKLEAGFHALAEALATSPGVPDPWTPSIIDRPDHGWMEWVASAPCQTRAEVEAFYRRCGAATALLRVLRGGDIHPDNLIAVGPYPAFVDLECLFQPGAEDLAGFDPLLDPVMFQSGVLPVFTSFDGGVTLHPIAAAGAGPAPAAPRRVLIHEGTDWAHLADRPAPSFADQGPRWNGATLDVRDHAESFCDGFSATLSALAARADLLDPSSGPGGMLAEGEARFLAAATNLYALTLRLSLSPAPLISEAAFGKAIGQLERRTPLVAAPDAWTAILRAERQALDRLDVPAFRFRPNDLQIRATDGAPVTTLPGQPPLPRIRVELAALTPTDIAQETAQLRAALRRNAWPATDVSEEGATVKSLIRTFCRQIRAHSIPLGGGVGWVRMWEQMPALVSPAGPSLAYGAGGVAVALAEAAHALGDSALAEMAIDALQPWTATIMSGGAERLARRIGPGWGRGAGGFCAALVWCADLLDAPRLLEAAEALALAASPAPTAGGIPDVMDGAAGLALGLWSLSRARPTPALAARAADCGAEILRASTLAEGRRSWPRRGGSGEVGLSHGAGGMAAGLTAVALITGEAQWREASREALAYEDLHFNAEVGNWVSPGAASPGKSTWCHGAPGVALTRMALLEHDPTLAEVQANLVRIGLATASQRRLSDVDDLCCGEAGRIEILDLAAARLDEPSLSEAADSALAARLTDWRAGRVLTMSAQAGAPTDVSLFRGLAGPVHVLSRRLSGRGAPVLMPLLGL